MKRVLGTAAVAFAMVSMVSAISMWSGSVAAAMPGIGVDGLMSKPSALKIDVQAKKRRGPCLSGDAYDKATRQCKGADSAAYASGDSAAGRCRAGDRYNARGKDCRGADKKRYPADMKQ
ncbi:MAG: hypothetical protein RIB59_16470, partial [Rhodospirillales bacterium]